MPTTETIPVTLDVGVHYDIPAHVYHADPCPIPSLSSGIARTINAESLAEAYRRHVRFGGMKKPRTAAMDAGALVHSLIAERPDDFEVGNYDNYQSNAAKAWRDNVIASGRNAALEKHLDNARRIVASLKKNVCNGGITNDPFAAHGKSEVTIIWKERDAYCRCLPDRMLIEPGAIDVWDWKITNDVTDRAILRSVMKWGYHEQEALYRRGISAAFPGHRISWMFAFVLDCEPYTVRRVCLTPEFLAAGKRAVSSAIAAWQQATKTNVWPDKSEETLHLDAPGYLLDDEISAS